MYETVKIVNGVNIYKMKGTRRSYWVDVKENVRMNFETIKAATEYINSAAGR